MSLCPCGSRQEYAVCCEPFHQGAAAPTAEKLMRSRYSAFEKGEMQYLEDTLIEEARVDYDAAETDTWAKSAIWKKLEIGKTEAGQENDETGIVEFKAYFKMNGQHQVHHEISRFAKRDGRWYYVDGEMNPKQEQRIVTVKAGRNDPCPCGSGKKYKKCCGA
ncbi:MAG: YchJ family protein [Methylocystaceae bacterium]|nr:YchJ family protein [Methylocystaceae bacterium]